MALTHTTPLSPLLSESKAEASLDLLYGWGAFGARSLPLGYVNAHCTVDGSVGVRGPGLGAHVDVKEHWLIR